MSKQGYPAPTAEPFTNARFTGSNDMLVELLNDMVAAGEGAITSRTYASLHALAVERGLFTVPTVNTTSIVLNGIHAKVTLTQNSVSGRLGVETTDGSDLGAGVTSPLLRRASNTAGGAR